MLRIQLSKFMTMTDCWQKMKKKTFPGKTTGKSFNPLCCNRIKRVPLKTKLMDSSSSASRGSEGPTDRSAPVYWTQLLMNCNTLHLRCPTAAHFSVIVRKCCNRCKSVDAAMLPVMDFDFYD